MKKLVFILIFVYFSFYAFAQTYHSGSIQTDETWFAADNPHICTGDITVTSNSQPTLTLEPGVIVKFNAGKTMFIGHDSNAAYAGGLIANGTESDPITFTSNSATPAPGDWDYIKFRPFCIDANCQLEYATIEYGGLASTYGLLIDDTPVIVNNVTFQNNDGNGLKVTAFITGTQRPAISNCTFTGNTEFPIDVYANDLSALGEGNTYSGNGTDEIYVRADNIWDDQEWINQDIPLNISGDLILYTNGGVTLNIDFGTVLKFESQKDFTIGHPSNPSYWGTLNATGVEFRGTVDTPGHWYGLIIDNFTHGGTLSGCTIKNAGYGATNPKSIWIQTSPTVTQQTITGCQIIDGAGDGLYLNNDSRPFLSGNVISGNSEYPISTHVNDVGSLGPNNDLIGNGYDVIEVRSGIINESQIWNDHGIPYLLTNSINVYSTSNTHLQIMPGCIIQLKQGDYIQIGHTSNPSYSGSLEAEGVTFTRASAGEIHRGIYFAAYSEDANCILTDCIIEYGGDNVSYNAGVIITQSAPTLNHVTFRNNDGFGLRINDITEGDPLPDITNCRFYDNTEYPVRIYSSELSCLKEDNVYSGNNPDRIYVLGDWISYDTEWINQGIPFEVNNYITVSSTNEPHLIINSGIHLIFAAGEYLSVGHGSNPAYKGSIYAYGVTFSGLTGTPGEWDGISFQRYITEIDTELNNCVIEDATKNIYLYNSSALINQCISRNAQDYGIHCSGSLSNPSIYKCFIYLNDVGILGSSNASPIIGGNVGNANSFFLNTTYGVQNTGTTAIIDATYNWWGDASGPTHASNPGGTGDAVSDNVDFANFLTTSLSEAPSSFSLLSPAAGTVINSFDTLLDWETSIDPTPDDTVRYELKLSTSDDYLPENTTIITGIENSHYLLSDTVIDDDTRYWWKVTAYDLVGYETNSNQQNWYFDVFVADPPDPFTLISPDDLETVDETSVLLTWNAATDPDPDDSIVYKVYLDETASFSDPDSVVTAETGVYTPFCTPGTLFYWTVKATDTYGESTYSEVRSYYVDPSAGPRRPEWINITQNGSHIDLDWEPVPGADSYNIERSDESYSGFGFLDSSSTTDYTHTDAGLNFTKSFYRVKALDNDLVILYWRDLSGNRLN